MKHQEDPLPHGFTFSFHKDDKATVVEVDGKIYNLVETNHTLKSLLLEKDFKKIPHVRHLNAIRECSKEKQHARNYETEILHKDRHGRPERMSIKKAIIMGKDVPAEIERLMEEKKKAQKAGDQKQAKIIRKQLRALDYKRYLEKE
jgi:hypothetical protein